MTQHLLRDLLTPGTLPGAMFYGVLFLVLAAAAARGVRFAVKEAVQHDVHLIDATIVTFVGQLLNFAIYLGAITLYAHLIPQLRSLGTALLTGVSVVSVILGLAAQTTLGNLIAGVALLLYRPFRLGDRVQFSAAAGVEGGEVHRISLGYTILHTYDGRRVVVPNSTMVNQAVVNLTDAGRRVMGIVTVRLDRVQDIDTARAALLELARVHRLVRDVIGCNVLQTADPGITLVLRVWCDNAPDARQTEIELYEAARKRFDREQIPAH